MDPECLGEVVDGGQAHRLLLAVFDAVQGGKTQAPVVGELSSAQVRLCPEESHVCCEY